MVGLQTCLTFLLLPTLPVPPLFRSVLPRGSRPSGARRDTYWVQGRLSGGREVGRMHWYCFPQPAGLLWPFSLGALLCSLTRPSEQFSQRRGCFPPIEEKKWLEGGNVLDIFTNAKGRANFSRPNNCFLRSPSQTLMLALLFLITCVKSSCKVYFSARGSWALRRQGLLCILVIPGPSTMHVTKDASAAFGKLTVSRISNLGWGQHSATRWRLDFKQIMSLHWFSVLASIKWEVKLGDF